MLGAGASGAGVGGSGPGTAGGTGGKSWKSVDVAGTVTTSFPYRIRRRLPSCATKRTTVPGGSLTRPKRSATSVGLVITNVVRGGCAAASVVVVATAAVPAPFAVILGSNNGAPVFAFDVVADPGALPAPVPGAPLFAFDEDGAP